MRLTYMSGSNTLLPLPAAPSVWIGSHLNVATILSLFFWGLFTPKSTHTDLLLPNPRQVTAMFRLFSAKVALRSIQLISHRCHRSPSLTFGFWKYLEGLFFFPLSRWTFKAFWCNMCYVFTQSLSDFYPKTWENMFLLWLWLILDYY